MAGAASGAAAGTSIMPGWGTAIGAGLGYLAGNSIGGDAPQQVNPVDPAFINSLYNQSMGTEKTAADMKMKAAFDQTLAQQVAAARASRGVNPGLLQRNVARMASEQGARAAQVGAEENIKNQDNARSRYLQAIALNQQAEKINAENATAADARDQKQLGALINGMGAIGSTFATAKGTDNKDLPDVPAGAAAPAGQEAYAAPPENSTEQAAQLTNAYTMGAKEYSDGSPDLRAMSESDRNSKKNIKQEGDLKVMSDERQKDLIKNESLPQNGNMGMQNQQAMQPQGGAQVPPMAAFAQPQQAAPQMSQTPAATPAPMSPSQTALAQANASMSKGGRVDDLQVKANTLQAPSEGPSQQQILEMTVDAKNRQSRDMFGNVTQSDADNYQANLSRWYAKQAEQRAAFTKESGEIEKNNMNVNSERMARLSKFYTGNSNTNAGDVAQLYAPKSQLLDTSWNASQHALQQAQNSGQVGFGLNKGGLFSTSDERSKENIAPQSNVSSGDMSPKGFLDKLSAYSYEYKEGQKSNPNAGEGRFLGTMAQELEAAGPVGKSMVEQDPKTGVKNVNYGKGFSTILAAQIQLNERLKAIEAKKPK